MATSDQPNAAPRGNAVKHGLRATDKLFLAHLAEDERQVFDEFRQSIHEEYHPITIQEKLLVDHIAVQHFRLFRLYHLEYQATRQSSNNPLAPESVIPHLDRFSRYDSRIERQLRVLHNRLRTLFFKRGDYSLIAFPVRE
jgi:hypothetical protein